MRQHPESAAFAQPAVPQHNRLAAVHPGLPVCSAARLSPCPPPMQILNGLTTCDQGLIVNNVAGILNNGLTVNGAVSALNGGLNVLGTSSLADVNVAGLADLSNGLNVDGAASINVLTTTSDTTLASLEVTGDTKLSNLEVTGSLSVSGATNLGKASGWAGMHCVTPRWCGLAVLPPLADCITACSRWPGSHLAWRVATLCNCPPLLDWPLLHPALQTSITHNADEAALTVSNSEWAGRAVWASLCLS